MSLSVTVLGCSGVFQTREQAASGFLIEIDAGRWLMDAGGGTWRNLLDHVDYRDVDGVLLSHRHSDHTIDILQLFHARHYGDIEAPQTKIPLWAPQETIDRLLAFEESLAESFDVVPIDQDSEISLGRARVTFARMKHPPVTLGVRIESGDGAFAYSADSGIEGDFEAIARGAQILVCEATVQDEDEPWWGHLSASGAGSIAARYGVGRLVLTHLRPGCDRELSLQQARRAAPGIEVELATAGLRLEVG